MSGGRRLAVAVVIIAIVWLGVLPRVARWERVRVRTERLEAAGIEPHAMFYTDLPPGRLLVDRQGR